MYYSLKNTILNNNLWSDLTVECSFTHACDEEDIQYNATIKCAEKLWFIKTILAAKAVETICSNLF